MNELNRNLLNSIDSIEMTVFESDLNVLSAIGQSYTKLSMLMEYADEEVLNEYSIIQESTFITEGVIGEAIKSALVIVFRMVVSFFTTVLLGKVFSKYADKMFNSSTKKNDSDTDGTENTNVLIQKTTRLYAKLNKNNYNLSEISDKDLDTLIRGSNASIESGKLGPEEVETMKDFIERFEAEKRDRAREKNQTKREELKKVTYQVADSDISDETASSHINVNKSMLEKIIKAMDSATYMTDKKYDQGKLDQLWESKIVESKDENVKNAVKRLKKQNQQYGVKFDNGFKQGFFTAVGYIQKFVDDITWLGDNLGKSDDTYKQRIDKAISYDCIYTELSSEKSKDEHKKILNAQMHKLQSIDLSSAKSKLNAAGNEGVKEISGLLNTKLIPYVSKQTAEMTAYNKALGEIYNVL